MAPPAPAPSMALGGEPMAETAASVSRPEERKAGRNGGGEGGGGAAPQPDLSQVAARTNLNETAFFFPHLSFDKDGSVSIQFTMPEALTRWKFLGVAHGKGWSRARSRTRA